MAFTLFFCLFPPPSEKCNWAVLWGGETTVPRGEKEGLRVWSLSDHTGQIHQHVRCVGWVEKHEVQCEERPLSLQAVRGKGQQDPGLCCQVSGLPRDGSSCFFSGSFFFKNSLFTCGTNYLETKDGLIAVKQLDYIRFLCAVLPAAKGFSAFNAKLSNMSWYMLNVMHMLCSVKLLFLSLRGSWLSGCLCCSCSDLFYSWHPFLTFVAETCYTRS